ncbi:hypothetical protein DSO57_1002031 [Entomophthora muscae]|uniref:Uncharacterized protein n=1 Tax=Entomophthora muscae TaxID=34485 RepID=A0ACC2SAN0_9FUNG|nr:hypothetical protein DSO57_1002031 [Entomophthora muscae]
MTSPPPSCPAEEGVPLLAAAAITIPPGSQVMIDSQISYEMTERLFLELYSPKFLSYKEPWLCPGTLDQFHKEPVQLLLANLDALFMQVSRGQVVGHGRILGAEQVASLYLFGKFSDFKLPDENPQVLSLFTATDFLQLSSIRKKDVLELLDQFNSIFASGPNNYGLEKGVIYQIDTGDAPPFRAKPYCCSRVEDAQVSKEPKKLLNVEYWCRAQKPVLAWAPLGSRFSADLFCSVVWGSSPWLHFFLCLSLWGVWALFCGLVLGFWLCCWVCFPAPPMVQLQFRGVCCSFSGGLPFRLGGGSPPVDLCVFLLSFALFFLSFFSLCLFVHPRFLPIPLAISCYLCQSSLHP